MKQYVVIGLGHFGSWVARALYAKGFEVLAIDREPALVDRLADGVTRGIVGDATDRALLERLGAGDADAAVISTGGDLAASILATQALRDLGLDEIYVKVTSEEMARALDIFGVKETVFPEREIAFRLAQRLPSKTVLDYIPLARGYSIQELAMPDRWLGRSLRELALPRRYGIQIVALYDVLKGAFQVVPDPDEPLKDSDIAIVAGSDEDIEAVVRSAQ